VHASLRVDHAAAGDGATLSRFGGRGAAVIIQVAVGFVLASDKRDPADGHRRGGEQTGDVSHKGLTDWFDVGSDPARRRATELLTSFW
jgi:hypothetical protein